MSLLRHPDSGTCPWDRRSCSQTERPRPCSLSYSAAFSKRPSPATNKKRPSKLLVIFGIKQPQPNEEHAASVQGDSPLTSARAVGQGSDPLHEGGSRALCHTDVRQPPVDHCPALASEQRPLTVRSALTLHRSSAGSDLSGLLRYRGGLSGARRRDPIDKREQTTGP